MPNIRGYTATIVDTTTNALVGSTNFQEGQQARTLNNSNRQYAADVKTFANELPWYDIGHTPTRTGNTTFTIPTDVTSIYTVDRRLKLGDSTTLYASVVSAAFGAVTTITVRVDGGTALSASLTTVAYAIEDPSNVSQPAEFGRKRAVTTGGSLTAYTATFSPPVPALVDNLTIDVILHATCGAAPTLAVDGLAATTISLPGNGAVASGNLMANSALRLVYKSGINRWLVHGVSAVVENAMTATTHAAIRSF